MMDAAANDILRKRAIELARPLQGSGPADTREFVIFKLGDGMFGFDLDGVVEVFTPREVTPVPGWANGRGALTAWRGALLLLIDIRDVVGASQMPNRKVDRAIVLQAGQHTAGIMVDEVIGMRAMPETEMRATPEKLAGTGMMLMNRVTDDGVMLLDHEHLLSYYAQGGTL